MPEENKIRLPNGGVRQAWPTQIIMGKRNPWGNVGYTAMKSHSLCARSPNCPLAFGEALKLYVGVSTKALKL